MKSKLLESELELTTSSPDDPRLKKKWGYISALPSEYLIHFRKGRLDEKNSGQGAGCFKHLRDTIFIVPTSLKEIVFEANQLTVDNVDVKIKGMAVYRINNPLRIFKLINFSNRQNAEEKLARMIGDMCRSTSKWLVANMKVEECIRKRKEEIAETLKKEISFVVADETTGWGVEIITIDIQDVYIQDTEIFSAVQMMFKTEKIRESELAKMEMARKLELSKIENEQFLAEHRKNNELNKARIEAEIKDEAIKLAKQNDEKQFELDRYRVEQGEILANYKLNQDINREKQKLDLALEKSQKDTEAKSIIHKEEIEALEKKIQVENSASSISLEKNFIETALPVIAEVLAKSMKDVKINIFQQDGKGGGITPFHFILTELMQIFKERIAPLSGKKNH